MKINTLGDFTRRLPPQPSTGDPIAVRTRLYSAMGDYMSAALAYAEDSTDENRQMYAIRAGRFVEHLLRDAQAHLSADKYTYLLAHSVADDEASYRENPGELMNSINYLWGGEDMFMFRLSNGRLPGSYVKALVGLKGQARHVAYTVPQIMTTYIKSRSK